jgi:hypothetical protein
MIHKTKLPGYPITTSTTLNPSNPLLLRHISNEKRLSHDIPTCLYARRSTLTILSIRISHSPDPIQLTPSSMLTRDVHQSLASPDRSHPW